MANTVLSRSDRAEIEVMINQKANEAQSAITAKKPKWEDEVTKLSRKLAIGALRIESDLVKLDKLNNQIAALEAQRDRLEAQIQQKLPLNADDNGRHRGTCREHMSICEAVDRLMAESRPNAMARHPVGKEVLKIQKRKQEKLSALYKCANRQDVAALKCLDWDK